MVWEGLPCENKLRQTGLIVLASILVPTGCVLLGLLTKWIARNEVRDTPSIYPLVCPYKAQKPFLPLLFAFTNLKKRQTAATVWLAKRRPQRRPKSRYQHEF